MGKQTRKKNKALGLTKLRKDKARERKGNFYFEITQKNTRNGGKTCNVLHNFINRAEIQKQELPLVHQLLIGLAKDKLIENKEKEVQ